MRILDRCGAFTGVAYVLLILVGNQLSTDNYPGRSDAHPSGQQDIDYLHWLAGSSSAQIGLTMELAGFAVFMLFIGYLCSRIRAGGWLATAALAGGVIAVAVKLASGAPILASYVLRDDLTPGTARALSDMGGAAFVLDWLPTGLFVACAAGAALAGDVVGRVLGWGGVAVGTVAVVGTAVTGVHILDANALPFMLCLLWILAVSVRLGIRRSEPAIEATPDVESVGV
jgi:hypothetical protein